MILDYLVKLPTRFDAPEPAEQVNEFLARVHREPQRWNVFAEPAAQKVAHGSAHVSNVTTQWR